MSERIEAIMREIAERDANDPPSIAQSGADIIKRQERAPVLADDERAAVSVTGEGGNVHVAGAVAVGEGKEIIGGVDKPKGKGLGWFAGFSWRK